MSNDSPSLASIPLVHVFVATNETQGARENDFCFATVGELVHFALECDGETIDGPCGCHRAVAGIDSLMATTTFTVAARAMSVSDLADALERSYQASGWGSLLSRDGFIAEARELLELAAGFPVGTVLEKRGNAIRSRSISGRIGEATNKKAC